MTSSEPQTYTVEGIASAQPKTLEGKGEFVSYRLMFKGVGMAEWFTKASTPTPKPGDQLTGTVEETQYGLKFKKSPPQGGFGGGRGMDPATQKRVTRLAAQERALRYMHVKGVTDFKLDDSFRKVIRWFADDAEAAEKS